METVASCGRVWSLSPPLRSANRSWRHRPEIKRVKALVHPVFPSPWPARWTPPLTARALRRESAWGWAVAPSRVCDSPGLPGTGLPCPQSFRPPSGSCRTPGPLPGERPVLPGRAPPPKLAYPRLADNTAGWEPAGLLGSVHPGLRAHSWHPHPSSGSCEQPRPSAASHEEQRLCSLSPSATVRHPERHPCAGAGAVRKCSTPYDVPVEDEFLLAQLLWFCFVFFMDQKKLFVLSPYRCHPVLIKEPSEGRSPPTEDELCPRATPHGLARGIWSFYVTLMSTCCTSAVPGVTAGGKACASGPGVGH